MLLLQVDNTSFYDQNVTLIAGCVLIALLGLWYYRLQKKNPNLDFGPLVATAMVDKHETIFMGIIFLEYIMTAIIASTVRSPNQHGLEMSPFGRLGLHIALSLTGTVAQFTLARDIAILFIKRPVGEYLGNFVTTIIITIIAIAIPYINLMLIASSLGESLAFDVWVYSHTPFLSDQELINKYVELGYPPDYQPWENLSPVLHVCIASAGIVHYLLTAVEGLRTISSPKRRKMLMDRVKSEQVMDDEKSDDKSGKKDDKGKVTDDPMPAQKRQVEATESNVKWLLRRKGYSGSKLDTLVNEITKKILEPADKAEGDKEATKFLYASKIAAWKLKGESLDRNPPSDKKEQNEKLLNDFTAFVEGTVRDDKGQLLPKEKRGLGLKLKN